MLVSYNKIKHISDIHTHLNISADVFDTNSNTKSLCQRIGWILDEAIRADYGICFVDMGEIDYNAGFAMPCDEKLYGKPSLVFFISQNLCFEDIERNWRHETAHIKQLKDGRLKMSNNKCYWEGVEHKLLYLTVFPNPENDISYADDVMKNLQYYAQPWELDAQNGIWDIRDSFYKLCSMLIEQHGTCWKQEWDTDVRRDSIKKHGLGYAFQDLIGLNGQYPMPSQNLSG